MATSQVETVGAGADKAKVAIALALVLAGFASYFILSSQSSYIRWGVLLVGVLAGVAVFMLSGAGRALLSFAQDSEREMRKVVWPTRKEATQMTVMVFVFVFVLALFMWLVDSGLSWLFYDILLKRG